MKLHRVFLSNSVRGGIFTSFIIYTGTLNRKGSSRSILHAGRYLNDNEFCYLGTIKVMADVD